jgi:hypothetical protein
MIYYGIGTLNPFTSDDEANRYHSLRYHTALEIYKQFAHVTAIKNAGAQLANEDLIATAAEALRYADAFMVVMTGSKQAIDAEIAKTIANAGLAEVPPSGTEKPGPAAS